MEKQLKNKENIVIFIYMDIWSGSMLRRYPYTHYSHWPINRYTL